MDGHEEEYGIEEFVGMAARIEQMAQALAAVAGRNVILESNLTAATKRIAELERRAASSEGALSAVVSAMAVQRCTVCNALRGFAKRVIEPLAAAKRAAEQWPVSG